MIEVISPGTAASTAAKSTSSTSRAACRSTGCSTRIGSARVLPARRQTVVTNCTGSGRRHLPQPDREGSLDQARMALAATAPVRCVRSLRSGVSLMPLRVLGTDLHVVNMRLRMPFRYGIVTLTALPHLFVRAEVEIDGDAARRARRGPPGAEVVHEGPADAARDELAEMFKVIETACDVARAAGKHRSVFDWWLHTYQGQAAWAGGWGIPPLLAHFGTSLIERAVIDAFCRAQGVPFATRRAGEPARHSTRRPAPGARRRAAGRLPAGRAAAVGHRAAHGRPDRPADRMPTSPRPTA